PILPIQDPVALSMAAPRAESIQAPLPQTAVGESRDSIWSEAPTAPDGRIAKEPLELLAVCLFPGSQEEMRRLDHSNIRTVRATSPAFIARNASLTSSSRPRRVIISS